MKNECESEIHSDLLKISDPIALECEIDLLDSDAADVVFLCNHCNQEIENPLLHAVNDHLHFF